MPKNPLIQDYQQHKSKQATDKSGEGIRPTTGSFSGGNSLIQDYQIHRQEKARQLMNKSKERAARIVRANEKFKSGEDFTKKDFPNKPKDWIDEVNRNRKLRARGETLESGEPWPIAPSKAPNEGPTRPGPWETIVTKPLQSNWKGAQEMWWNAVKMTVDPFDEPTEQEKKNAQKRKKEEEEERKRFYKERYGKNWEEEWEEKKNIERGMRQTVDKALPNPWQEWGKKTGKAFTKEMGFISDAIKEDHIYELQKDKAQIARSVMNNKPGTQLNDWREVSFTVSNSTLSLLQAMGISAITGSPSAGAVALSSLETLPEYQKAIDAGKTPGEAATYTLGTTAGNAMLEKAGLDAILNTAGKGLLTRSLISGTTETGQEISQQVFQGLTKRHTYDESAKLMQDWTGTILGSFVAGGFGGAIAPAANTQMNKDDMIQRVQEWTGLEKDQASEFLDVAIEKGVKMKDNIIQLNEQEKARPVDKRFLLKERYGEDTETQYGKISELSDENLDDAAADLEEKERTGEIIVPDGDQIGIQTKEDSQLPQQGETVALSDLQRAPREAEVSEELQPLAEEAQKYDSAEEFKDFLRENSEQYRDEINTIRKELGEFGEEGTLEVFGVEKGVKKLTNDPYNKFYNQVTIEGGPQIAVEDNPQSDDPKRYQKAQDNAEMQMENPEQWPIRAVKDGDTYYVKEGIARYERAQEEGINDYPVEVAKDRTIPDEVPPRIEQIDEDNLPEDAKTQLNKIRNTREQLEQGEITADEAEDTIRQAEQTLTNTLEQEGTIEEWHKQRRKEGAPTPQETHGGPGDEIAKLLGQNGIMKKPGDTWRDWRDALGKGNYMRLFRKKSNKRTPDEVADDLGMTENELMEEMRKRLQHNESFTENSNYSYQEFAEAMQRKFPHAHIAYEHDIAWKELNDMQQKAIEVWAKEGNDGIPPKLGLTQDQMLKKGQEPEAPSPDESYAGIPDLDSPKRTLETELNLNVDGRKVTRKLAHLVHKHIDDTKDVSEGQMYQEATEKGERVTRFRIKNLRVHQPLFGRNSWIKDDSKGDNFVSLQRFDNPIVAAHEVAHSVDHGLVTDREGGALPTSLTERTGISGKEDVYLKELNRIRKEMRRHTDRKLEESPSELFAQFYSVYLLDPAMARAYAPQFSKDFEAANPEAVEFADEFNKWFRNNAKAYQGQRNRVIEGIISMLESAGIGARKRFRTFKAQVMMPKWKAEYDDAWKSAFKFVQEKTIYDRNRAIAELHRMHQRLEDLDLDDTQKEELKRVLQSGNAQNNQTEWTDDQLESLHGIYRESSKEAYHIIRNMVQSAKEDYKEVLLLQRGYYDEGIDQDRRAEIRENVNEQLDKIGGYLPMQREGKWVVYGEIQQAGRKTPDTFYNRYKTKGKAQEVADTLGEMGYDKVSGPNEFKALPPAMIEDLKNMSYARLKDVLSQLEEEEATQVQNAIRETLLKKLNRGELLERNYVPGLDRNFDDIVAAVENFNQSAAASKHQAQISDHFRRNVMPRVDPYKNPESYQALKEYQEAIKSGGSRVTRNIKKGLYLWSLSFKTSFLVQNLTQPFMTTLPELANHVGLTKSANILRKSYKNLAKHYIQGEDALPEKHQELLNRAFKEGVIGSPQTKYLLGLQRNPVRSGLDKFTKQLGLFGRSSEIINRFVTAEAAIQVAESKGMTDKQDIYDFMITLNNRTQFAYGRHNMPVGITKQKGFISSTLRAMATFRTFIGNYLHFFNQRIVHGSGGAKALGFGAPASISGLLGLPFAKGVAWLVQSLFKKQPEKELREAVGADNTKVADVLLHGFPALANINTTMMIGMGDIISPDFPIQEQIFGISYGLGKDFAQGASSIAQGDMKRGMEKLSPAAVRYWMTGQRWEERGLEPSDKVYVQPSKWEATARKLGFQPARISKAYEIQSIKSFYGNQKTRTKNKIDNRIRRLADTQKGRQLLIAVYKEAQGNYYDPKKIKLVAGQKNMRDINRISNQSMDALALYYNYKVSGQKVEPDQLKTMWKRYDISPEEIGGWVKDFVNKRAALEERKQNR